MSAPCKVSIFGAAVYIGEELIRLLSTHPTVEITLLTSRSHDGKHVSEVFSRFRDLDLHFSQPCVDEAVHQTDVAFLSLPHGLAAEFARPLLDRRMTVIDLSADFRLRNTDTYEQYYGAAHPAPELLSQAVYGLPERYRAEIATAKLIACPGCYPTSIILPGAALLAAGEISPEGIVICSMSGVSGAGRKLDVPYLFSECNESLRAYSPSGHRHTPEITQELAAAAELGSITLNFIPHLVPVTRGIHSTIVANALGTAESAHAALCAAYHEEPFVRVLPLGVLPDTKHVTKTNCCEIGIVHDRATGKLIITSAEDNLTKGAAGQAIQCLNLTQRWPETTGLL